MRVILQLLRSNREFRHLYFAQSVSYFGTLLSLFVVIPFQVYEATQSSAMVGWVSAVELIPMTGAALIGGVIADQFNRKKIVLWAEGFMALGCLILSFNCLGGTPHIPTIFVASALLQIASGLHRPAMDSLAQSLLGPAEIAPASAAQSLKFGSLALIAPGIGGLVVSRWGAHAAYLIGMISFGMSIALLLLVHAPRFPHAQEALHFVRNLRAGLAYVRGRPEILATYLIDFTAMALAFPMALFPALADQWDQKESLGLFYSALSAGSITVPLWGQRLGRLNQEGRLIIVSAALWGAFIALFAFAGSFQWALASLFVAGLADTVSGYFRSLVWNQTIPNEVRGRTAGLEMISYMAGPLIGNLRAGWVGAYLGTTLSLCSGGVACLLSVIGITAALPVLWRYRINGPTESLTA